MLTKASVDTTRVTYVPADFETEDWFEKLVDAGFEPDKPSFFVWESVTMYLDREAVENTSSGSSSGDLLQRAVTLNALRKPIGQCSRRNLYLT